METPDPIMRLFAWAMMFSPWVVIPSWFLKRWALQGIGSRWGVPHAWLVWIPGLHSYTPGAISDRYRTTVKGRGKSRRRFWLPLLRIAWVVLWIPAVKVLAEGYLQYQEIVSIGASEIAANMMFGYALLDALVFIIPALILWLIETVLRWMVLYEIYAVSKPGRGGLYLALSLIPVVNLIAQPVLLLRCRDKGESIPIQA